MGAGDEMEFERDEAKRLSNLEKHGLDFLVAHRVFNERHLVEPAAASGSAMRYLVLGRLDLPYVTPIDTLRG